MHGSRPPDTDINESKLPSRNHLHFYCSLALSASIRWQFLKRLPYLYLKTVKITYIDYVFLYSSTMNNIILYQLCGQDCFLLKEAHIDPLSAT